jgi:alcohol dehydrogenase YqhD (iron-dependent ADH family)
MMHTMERYFNPDGDMTITDAIAEALMRTMKQCVFEVLKNPEDYRNRAQIMWAGSLAHNDVTGNRTNGDWATHQIEHELSAMFDVTHGAGLAVVWPSWARYVYKDCLPRFVRYAEKVMGVVDRGQGDEQIALEGIARMEDFYHRIGMPVNMRELGIAPTEAQILAMAASCAEAVGGKKGSARVLWPEDMVNIYRMAL